MVVITSGDKYIDIDAYASMIAFREYLKVKGIECVAISNSILNDSISKSLYNMDYKLDNYTPKKEDKYIILDVSEPEMLDKCVIPENIIEIIDHHSGYEEYWQNLLGHKSQIVNVGAVATLIYKKITTEKLERIIDCNLAKLLVAAILDNTLNLKAKVTTNEDIKAYQELMKIINDEEYPQKYYGEIEKAVKENIIRVLKNETNIYHISKIIPKYFSQLIVFDKNIVLNKIKEIDKELNKLNDEYIINLIVLSEKKSYIITPYKKVQEDMSSLLGGKFIKNIMILNDIWLRKEIIKKAKEKINNN